MCATHLETGALDIRLERLAHLPHEITSREEDQCSKSRDDTALQSLQKVQRIRRRQTPGLSASQLERGRLTSTIGTT